MTIAITRAVSPAIQQCELTYQSRTPVDYELACTQHHQYKRALADLGCHVITLPADADLPDSVFVEDTALVLDEIAVITRPGAESRRSETVSIARALAKYRSLVTITAPGTLEGGDILRVGKMVYVGLSGRSNPAGIEQLGELIIGYGYSVQPVEVTGCLHLKSAVTQVGLGRLLANPGWIDVRQFKGLEVIAIDSAEPHAANALLLGTGVIYPASFPRTSQLLTQQGVAVTQVDVSELQKAEGAVTCCSLVFEMLTQAG